MGIGTTPETSAEPVKGHSPGRLKAFVCRRFRLKRYLGRPGDGRKRPQVPAGALVWSLIIGHLLREPSFSGIEALVRSRARRALVVGRRFSNDTLGYFTERLDPRPTREALTSVVRQAKRNKAFEASGWIGLALDGTGAGWSAEEGCPLCHPHKDGEGRVTGYGHRLSLISVVGTGLSLPFDVEPYGPGECESTASQRLLRRAVEQLGRRFAHYVVADGAYATAPFLHVAGDLGLRVVARLKANLPELLRAAEERFGSTPPKETLPVGKDRVEIWDAEDFDPWESLRWDTVRVMRYRQHKPDGTVVDAYWLTDWPMDQAGSRTLYHMAKSRWEVENQGFNVSKTLYGMEHIAHHHKNSLLISWLMMLFAVMLDRLYRLRYLKRGRHAPYTAIEFLRLLRLSLSPSTVPDTS